MNKRKFSLSTQLWSNEVKPQKVCSFFRGRNGSLESCNDDEHTTGKILEKQFQEKARKLEETLILKEMKIEVCSLVCSILV